MKSPKERVMDALIPPRDEIDRNRREAQRARSKIEVEARRLMEIFAEIVEALREKKIDERRNH